MATLRSIDSKNSLLNDEAGSQNDYYLRVQLPNDMTTVMQVQGEMTMWEIMCVIASKKQLTPSQHVAKMVFQDGKSEMANESRALSSYVGLERLIVQKKPGEPLFVPLLSNNASIAERKWLLQDVGESANLARMRQGRRTSVVLNAPKPSTVRMSSQEFPRTETDEAVLAMRAAAAKADASVMSKNRKTIKNVAMFLFNKKSSADMLGDLSSSPSSGDISPFPPQSPRPISEANDSDSESRSAHRFSTSIPPGASESYNSKASSMQSLDCDLDTLYDGKAGKAAQSLLPPSPATGGGVRRYSAEPSRDPQPNRKSLLLRSATANGLSASVADVDSLSKSVSSVGVREEGDAAPSESYAEIEVSKPPDEDGPKSAPLVRTDSLIARDAQNREKIRKRTVSSPSTTGTSAYATLRRPVMRANRKPSTDLESGSESSSIMSPDSIADGSTSSLAAPGADDSKKVLLKVSLPDNQSTTILVHPEITMETLLSHICKKRLLEFDQYTLEIAKEGVTVEVDRPVGFYIQTCGIQGVIVVRKEKVYSTMCVNEGGQDVMILQIVNGVPQVMAATPGKLIERVSDEAEQDNKFLDTLLLTYRSFLKPIDFFDQLVARFNSELPPDPSPEDIEYFEKMKVPTQKRVIAAFKWWVQHHYHDFGVDSSIKADLEDFVDQIMKYNGGEFAADATELYEIIEMQGAAYAEMFNNYKAVERRGKTIEGMITVAAISVEDMSQQLCIHNFKLFHNIHPIEYLNQIWQSPDESSPSMKYFVDRFDKESYWVATEVVREKDLKKRVAVLRKFIHTGKMCQELNNFFSMYALIAGLNMPPVQRLKKSWEALPDKTKKTYAELEKIQDPSRNMKNYRDLLAVASPPIVPFLPLYLKDLIFMNDGNESKIGTERQMINFDKLRMMGNRVKDISGLASVEYSFEPLPPVQNFLSKPPVERSLAKLREMSLECEKPA